jgi:hypothetical protein
MIARASHQGGSQGATITAGGCEFPASQSREAGNSVLGKPSEASGDPFNLQQTFAAIWASGIVPPSIIDSEFLERLR